MLLNYLLPELGMMDDDRRQELLASASIRVAKRSALFNLLFPGCLVISFATVVVAPLLFIGTNSFSENSIWLYFLITGTLSYVCSMVSYHLFRARMLAPELRELIKGLDDSEKGAVIRDK